MRRFIVGATIAAALAPMFMVLAPVTSASASANCQTGAFAIKNKEGATMRVESNNVVEAVKGAETEFCQTLENSHGPIYTIHEDSNQNLCLTINGSGDAVVAAVCSTVGAEWHEYSSKTYSGFGLYQWEGDQGCATQPGTQPIDVVVEPCKDVGGYTSDIWATVP